jgi:hypothetical protein
VAADSLSGTLVLQDNSGNTNVLFIPPPSLIVDNGNLFKVSNPLVISLDSPYAGNVGDRVSVQFTHLVLSGGQWVVLNTPTGFGTTIDFGENSGGTDTVTVLFDSSAFISQTDLFGPLVETPVNILSFYFTNVTASVTNSGIGTFNYKTYSLDGALFTTARADGNSYEVFNFIGGDGGSYAGESIDTFGSITTNFGQFTFTLLNNGNFTPLSINGKTLVMTNSSGFFESVTFASGTFTETNSYNLTNSAGNFSYARSNSTLATTRLSFTNGPTLNFTNIVVTTFTTTNSGTFQTEIDDASGNLFTNYNGNFKLQ